MGQSKSNPIKYMNGVVEQNKKLRARNEYLESIHSNANAAIQNREEQIKDLTDKLNESKAVRAELIASLPFFAKWFVPKNLI